MIKINDSELKKICIEILKEIDDICKKNNIIYFVNFGTLIGTVRHQGFIPWDDDIDVCMPRKDYERFLILAEDSPKFKIIHDGNHKNYYFSFARFCDINTKLEIKGITQIEQMGVFVDIFPLDNVPENKKEREEYFKEVKNLDEMIVLSVPEKLKKTISLINRLRSIKRIKRFISAKKVGFNTLVEKRKKLMIKYNGKTALLSCMCPPDDRMTFKENIYLETKVMPFENIQVQAPLHYDTILSKYYGNYIELPPEEERISQHHFTAYYIENR